MASTARVERQPFQIPGPVGQLELLLETPTSANNKALPIAVLCHPHPLHGGSLQNKVVHTLARAAQTLGMRSLRFNFRGVGQSAGHYDQGEGESEDLLAVADWARRELAMQRCFLAGFSFGAYVAARCWQQTGAEHLLLAAPPVSLYDMQSIQPQLPWAVVQGSADEVIPFDAVAQWVAQQATPPTFHKMDGVSHFFHGQLVPLREWVSQQWQDYL